MALEITNTRTRRKESFQPITPGKVRMYVCGVTVYDFCHVGHGRAYVVFDVVYRWLSHLGFDVTYVRNFTDVDDKIIKRANEGGRTPEDITRQFIEAFHADMDKLGLVRPTIEPKATEHIPEMIAMIETLISRGHAYASSGDVYFAVASLRDYLKLSKRSLDDMRAGARVEPGEQKRDKADFALWKAAKPGEPKWKSPWGEGRPGWHIECSAMSSKYLGESFDIHGGGEDLIFPHHENEIAQSEGATGKEFARIWIHNAFVQMNAEKMSKSLGNVVRLRDILEQFPPEAFRMFVLSAHYRQPLDFTDESIRQGRERAERLYKALAEANEKLRTHQEQTPNIGPPSGPEFVEAEEFLKTMEARFTAAMNDDFNTAGAISILFEAARLVNRIVAKPSLTASDPPRVPRSERTVLEELREKLQRLATAVGLLEADPVVWLEQLRQSGAQAAGLAEADIDKKIEERLSARRMKDFKKADEIRNWLKERGVILEDKPDGSSGWRRS